MPLLEAARLAREGCRPPRVEWPEVDAVAVQRGPPGTREDGSNPITARTLLLYSEGTRPSSTRHGGHRWLHFRLKRHLQGEDGEFSRESSSYGIVLKAALTEQFPDGHYPRADCLKLISEVQRQVEYNTNPPDEPAPGPPTSRRDEADFVAFVQGNHMRGPALGRRVSLHENRSETAESYLKAVKVHMLGKKLGPFRRDQQLAKEMYDEVRGHGGVLGAALGQYYDWTADSRQTRLRPKGDAQPQAPRPKRRRVQGVGAKASYCLADYLTFLQNSKGIEEETKMHYKTTARKLFRRRGMAEELTKVRDCAPLAYSFLEETGQDATKVQIVSANVFALAAALPPRDAVRSEGRDMSRLAALLNGWAQFVAHMDEAEAR
jgi:hypothetical protein